MNRNEPLIAVPGNEKVHSIVSRSGVKAISELAYDTSHVTDTPDMVINIGANCYGYILNDDLNLEPARRRDEEITHHCYHDSTMSKGKEEPASYR